MCANNCSSYKMSNTDSCARTMFKLILLIDIVDLKITKKKKH